MDESQTLKPMLAKVSPYLPSTLISHPNKSLIDKLHIHLPMLNVVNIEVRLNNDDLWVDANFLVWLYEASVLYEWLENKKEPFYVALRKWVKDWMDPSKVYNQLIQNIWIMFDVDSDSDEIPDPWIIFTFSKVKVDPQSYQFIIKKIAGYFDNNYNSKHWNILQRIYSKLPTGSNVPAFGFQNRNINSLRTGVKEFHNLEQMESYLEDINWPGNMEFIREHYSDYISRADYCMLSITFNEEVIDYLGIECYLNEENNLEHSQAFLTKLQEQGLCSTAKQKALLDWIGNDHSKSDFWTLNPKYFNPEDEDIFMQRWLVEIKLVYKTNEPPSAKAYLLYHQNSLKLV